MTDVKIKTTKMDCPVFPAYNGINITMITAMHRVQQDFHRPLDDLFKTVEQNSKNRLLTLNIRGSLRWKSIGNM